MLIRRHVYYSGDVQGVGFRHMAASAARGYAVTGFVRNLADSRVELVAEGEEAEVAAFLAEIAEAMGGYIGDAAVTDEPPSGQFSVFRVAF